MSLVEVFLIGVGLSMDAFAVSVGKGLGMKRIDVPTSCKLAVSFGLFQAVMPVIGWALAASFADAIRSVDHWIAFALLVLVGGKMLVDAVRGEAEEPSGETGESPTVGFGELIVLSIATSIDALAVGIMFAALGVSPFPAVILIGVTTLALSFIGVVLGNRFGAVYERPANALGGIILIVIGVKVLVEHLTSGM